MKMNLQQQLPADPPHHSSFTAAAAAGKDVNHNFASSIPQDQDRVDDASVREEGFSPFSIGDDDGCEEKTSLFEVEGDEEDIIKRIHSDDTMLTQSTSDRDFAERTLPTDTFSFLIYSDVCSPSFLWGIIVFLFQIAIYIILGLSIIECEKKEKGLGIIDVDCINTKNPMGFPFNVTIPVRISEAIAILISIITQDDVRKAICLYRDGFDEGGLTQVFRGATLWKWSLSIVLRALEGLLGLVITFLLIMRSKSVLDLLLNFSAIEFITKLDDTVFELASEGFFGRKLKKEAKKLSRESYYVSHECANSYNATIISIAYLVVLLAAFFTGYGIIFWNQHRGKYLCDQIFSQFGDEALPTLGTFTGLFYRQNQQFGRRSSYRDYQPGGALLAYCEKDTRWTLSLPGDEMNTLKWDPCNWLAASQVVDDKSAKSFDLLSTTSSPWVINTPTNGAAPLTHHFMACNECENAEKSCGGKDRGECERANENEGFDQCKCKDGYYGVRCEYSDPCQTLGVNERDKGFPKVGGGKFASKYYRLEDADTYHRPVYTSLGDNEPLRNGTDFILFTGERWIMSYKNLFPDLKDVTDKKELAPFFSKFHGNFTNYTAVYESEPVYITKLLEVDADDKDKDKASPLSIRWRPSSSDTASIQQLHTGLQKDFIDTDFFCAVCNNVTNKCLNEGVCQNGTCVCLDGYSGSRCEISPKSLSASDGRCDQDYNIKQFEFDGGDCCESTCRSTSKHTCGKIDQGYIDTGYPSCVRDFNQWDLSGDTIYGVSSESRSGHIVALSGNGKVLAVADPGVSIVRLFDKDGAEWKQRGHHIQGKSESNFGSTISLSGESFDITGNPRTFPTVTLAVGAPKIGLVRVFTCSTDGCIQRGEDIIGSGRFGNSLSIDGNGESVAIGGGARESISQRTATNDEVKVFIWSNDAWEERGSVPIATPSSRKLSDSSDHFRLEGYYVSISGDYLAVGTLEGQVSPGPRFESANLTTQVFKWNYSSGWEQLGDEIERAFYDDASFGTPWPLKSVVIKGSVLAIGLNSTVDVYSWSDTSQEWIPKVVELAEGTEGFVGWSVDLSEDGDILAVGTSLENPQPTDESIRMYKRNGTHYKVLSNGVPGGPAASLSLSSDGKAVAVGLPFDSSNGGSTRVYNFYSESPCDDLSDILRISFTTDESPEETSWELRVDSEVKRRSGSLAGFMYTTFVEEICVPKTSCVRSIVYDTLGNGLTAPGVFALMLNGKEVAWGGNFQFYDLMSFGDCECSEDEASFTLATWSNFKPTDWSVVKQSTLTPYTGWKLVTSQDSFFTVVDECIPRDCYRLSPRQNDSDNLAVIYNATYDGKSILPTSEYGHVLSDHEYEFGEC